MYELNKNVYAVKGAKNAAIYNLNDGNVFSVNDKAWDMIERIVTHGDKSCNNEEITFLNSLKQAGLFSDDFSPRQASPPSKSNTELNFVWLELTEACNLRCLHCYEGNTHQGSSNELSTAQCERLLDDVYALGCRKIQFTGGECCLRNDLGHLIKYARHLGIDDITVFTNATLLTDEIIDTIADVKAKVRFSLYGYDAKTHDSITCVSGSFDKTVKNVKKLLDCSVHVSPAVVLMRQNETALTDIKRFIQSLGLTYSGYDVIRHVYGGTQSKFTPLNPKISEAKDRKSPSFNISKNKFCRALYHNTCWSGKIAITPSGDVIPCIFARSLILGNIKNTPLKNIIFSDSVQQCWDLDFSKIETCKDCEFRFACKDCRPMGMSTSNNIFAKNPRCHYDPYSGTWT